ncbi:MAG: hypothetical protein JHC96_09665, partial [Brevundimonas sp.]|nr:hypothetical protein [Brevundimonas sp.]
MRAYRIKSRETAMMRRWATGAAVLALAAGLSGCIIVASDGGERIVVQEASADLGAPAYVSLYTDAVADPKRPAEEVARDPLRHPAEILTFAQ